MAQARRALAGERGPPARDHPAPLQDSNRTLQMFVPMTPPTSKTKDLCPRQNGVQDSRLHVRGTVATHIEMHRLGVGIRQSTRNGGKTAGNAQSPEDLGFSKTVCTPLCSQSRISWAEKLASCIPRSLPDEAVVRALLQVVQGVPRSTRQTRPVRTQCFTRN